MTAPDNACPVEQVAAAIHEADPDVGVSWADWVAYAEEHPLHLQAVEFVRRQAREVLARQRTLPPAAEAMEKIMNWQSIETAPKDGTWILLRGRNSANHPMIPVVCAWRRGADGKVSWRDSASLRDMSQLVTDVPINSSADWMPLPAAALPLTDAGDGGENNPAPPSLEPHAARTP